MLPRTLPAVIIGAFISTAGRSWSRCFRRSPSPSIFSYFSHRQRYFHAFESNDYPRDRMEMKNSESFDPIGWISSRRNERVLVNDTSQSINRYGRKRNGNRKNLIWWASETGYLVSRGSSSCVEYRRSNRMLIFVFFFSFLLIVIMNTVWDTGYENKMVN